MLSFTVQSLFRPISMQNVPQSLTQFSRTDGCCTFPIDVKAPDSASNGATVQTGEEVVDPLTLLRATGTYSPTGATLHGRPVYRARNLGVLGEGLFLYFWPLPLDAASPGILWVIGPSVPAEASQTEQARVRESERALVAGAPGTRPQTPGTRAPPAPGCRVAGKLLRRHS